MARHRPTTTSNAAENGNSLSTRVKAYAHLSGAENHLRMAVHLVLACEIDSHGPRNWARFRSSEE
ncbi:hypothetical protein F01_390017 [Burkholderia cenocepacia]|nr:hypothetical protein F01_390017 [Burkholderia cenocepacia]